MDNKQFNTIRKDVKRYMNTLDLNEVREEFMNSDILISNAKLSKGDAINVGLELLPSVLGIFGNTCGAEGKCKLTCLVFSGRGNLMQKKRIVNGELSDTLKKRARRTFLYFNDRDFLESKMSIEIEANHSIAKLKGLDFGVRLNVFSDLDWSDFIAKHPQIQFYDYTKHFDRESTHNYDLTFSASEKTSKAQIVKVLTAGEKVAMVFRNKLPKTYFGFDVVDGDDTDNRYNDNGGIIIGLSMKTPIFGKTETSFVYSLDEK